jgi:saccharopine dehydrogenase (NADP+, L-glutamate forming)
MRATLRHPDFCAGWNALVQLGFTDSERPLPKSISRLADLTAWLVGAQHRKGELQTAISERLRLKPKSPVPNMFEWLGLFSEESLPAGAKTPGDALFRMLEQKWAMKPGDKDLVVMQHEVEYAHRGRSHLLKSAMVIKGENRELTAMAKTVGLPMGILAKLILKKRITPPQGVLIPSMPSVYKPVLAELAKYGIAFQESVH